jgi:hypothetical protein
MEETTQSSNLASQGHTEGLQNAMEAGYRLTSAELANLWSAYMSSSMKERIMQYFLAKVEDPEVRGILEYALHLAQIHLKTLWEIYRREEHPLPVGFTENDVKINAPRLFSDNFFLYYLEHLATIKLEGYGTALPMSARTDIRQFFSECLASSTELYNRVSSILLSRGLYLRTPFIAVPDKVDFVKKQSFFAGYWGERRPLTSIEISHLFSEIKNNSVRKALFTAFSQTAGTEQVRKYLLRGKEICDKHIEVFSTLLIKNGLPAPMSWDSGVFESTVAPFSDKLMVQGIVRTSNTVNVASYGKALSAGLRHDIAVDFTRLMADAVKYAEDGVNLTIDKGWLEEPPQAQNPGKTEQIH